MGCLFVALGAFFPRIAVLIVWLARPAVVDAAFGTFILPLLGLIFLPFTTLIYLILFTPGVGLSGWDWLWIALAVVIDVGNLGANSYSARKETGWRT
jgi:hypothetical protein